MPEILYYADKDTQHIRNGALLQKYYIQAPRITGDLKGNVYNIIKMGLWLEEYYSKNASKITFVNCNHDLREKGYRPLTKDEETLLWLGMNVRIKGNEYVNEQVKDNNSRKYNHNNNK